MMANKSTTKMKKKYAKPQSEPSIFLIIKNKQAKKFLKQVIRFA